MFYPGYTHNKVLKMGHLWFLEMNDHKNKVLEKQKEEVEQYGKLRRSQTNNQSRYRTGRR
jgi:hypothetical protein